MTDDERVEWIKNNRQGENNPNYGKTHTDEMKEAQSLRMKEWHKNNKHPNTRPEVKEKLRRSKIGENNPRAKKFRIEYTNGEVDIIKGIDKYCRDIGITKYKLKKMCNVEEIYE